MVPPVSQVELTGFDHVELCVRNRAKARRFFVEQLGLEVLGEGPVHCFLLLGDQVLGLRELPKGARGGGVDHLALRVASWTGLRNRVRRARIEVEGEKERDSSRSLYLKGPDGLKVELVYRPDPTIQACASAPVPPDVPVDED